MPTFATTDTFRKDFTNLSPEEKVRFRGKVTDFVEDLENERGFRPGLRVKRVVSAGRIWEMTWAPDGRATWEYGDEIRAGDPHVIWRRVGTHDVFDAP